MLADAVRFLLKAAVLLRMPRVLLVRDADDLLERRGDQLILHLADAGDHLSVFHAPRRLHDHEAARRRPQPAGIKVV